MVGERIRLFSRVVKDYERKCDRSERAGYNNLESFTNFLTILLK